MAGDSEVPISAGSGTDIATYLDTGGNHHQKVILQMQGPTDPQDPVNVNSTNPVPVTSATLALEAGGNLATIASATSLIATDLGTPGTGDSPPAGGAGLLGFLSGIFTAITGILKVAATSFVPLDANQATPAAQDPVLTTTSPQPVTIPGGATTTSTTLRIVNDGPDTIAWCYGNNSNLTLNNGVFMLANSAETFGVPASGLTQLSVIGNAGGSNFRVHAGTGQ